MVFTVYLDINHKYSQIVFGIFFFNIKCLTFASQFINTK